MHVYVRLAAAALLALAAGGCNSGSSDKKSSSASASTSAATTGGTTTGGTTTGGTTTGGTTTGAGPGGTAIPPATTPIVNLPDPDSPGPYAVGQRDETIAGASGDAPAVRIYYPATQAGAGATPDPSGGPYPAVIYNHGFKPPFLSFGIGHQSNAFVAEHLASHGYVVACVDLATNNDLFGTGQQNSERDAADTIAALDHLEQTSADPADPLSGLIDTTRAAFGGHSRGGDGAIMAASQELLARGAGARVKALFVFGPPARDSQNNNVGLAFGAFAAVPALLVGASDDAIAPFSEQQLILNECGSPSMLIEISGGNHSQYKDNGTLIWGDGAATLPLADQQAVCQRYATAWLETHVRGRSDYADYVMNGPQVSSDARLSNLTTR
jgi:predicted dienelactone hydrolase